MTKRDRSQATTQKDYATTVAETLIEQMKQGTAPWQKPWVAGNDRLMPYNAATGKDYRGGNAMYLWAVGIMEGYGDSRWMTYRQASEQGAQVRKGEHGTRIQYVMFAGEEAVTDANGKPVMGEDGKPKKAWVEYDRPRTMHYTVFNAAQIDGLPPPQERPALPEWQRHETAEAILAASGAAIQHQDGNRAFYDLRNDRITLPTREQFPNADGYYATALHELGHWTGHESRLNRDMAHPFGSEGYAKEELRAEIASLMLGDKLGIGHDPTQHAAYVASWIKVLEEDPREIFRAASDAEKIGSYVLGLQQQREQTEQQTPVQEPAAIGAAQAMAATVAAVGDAVRFEPNGQTIAGLTPIDGPVTGVLVHRSQSAAGGERYKIAENPADLATTVTAYASQGTLRAVDARELDPAKRTPVHVAQEAAAMTPQRTYLAVPYREKDQAKAAGARWDKEAKRWFAPEGADPAKLAAWMPENRPSTPDVPADPREQFAEALKENGLQIDGLPDMDGKLHRVQADGDKSDERSGAYVGYLDGHPAGYIQNFRTGVKTNWKSSAAAPALTDADKARLETEAAEKRATREAEREAVYQVTAAHVTAELANAAFATGDHPYLVSKGLAGEAPGLRVDAQGNLLVPVHGPGAGGDFWSVQRIGEDGRKGFEKDGRMAGGYFMTVRPNGELSSADPHRSPIVIAEGWATAESIGRATGATTVVAFNAGNLMAVATSMREQYPDRPIIIAGDNDVKREREGKPNVGKEAALAAAAAVNGHAAIPQFKRGDQGSDWNDVANSQGNEVVKQAMLESMAIADRKLIADAQYTGHDATRAAEKATLDQSQVNTEAATNSDEITAAMSSAFTRIRDKAEDVEDQQDNENKHAPQRRSGRGRSR